MSMKPGLSVAHDSPVKRIALLSGDCLDKPAVDGVAVDSGRADAAVIDLSHHCHEAGDGAINGRAVPAR
jgi:hypothetical protein